MSTTIRLTSTRASLVASFFRRLFTLGGCGAAAEPTDYQSLQSYLRASPSCGYADRTSCVNTFCGSAAEPTVARDAYAWHRAGTLRVPCCDNPCAMGKISLLSVVREKGSGRYMAVDQILGEWADCAWFEAGARQTRRMRLSDLEIVPAPGLNDQLWREAFRAASQKRVG